MTDIAPPPYSETKAADQASTSQNPFAGQASSVAAKIHALAPQREALLQTLRDTDYAPPALQQQQSSLADLQSRLKKVDASLQKLQSSRLKELKEHEKYRDSIMKRFAYRASGRREKFEERAAKEEREYFDALQEEHQANEQKRGIESDIKETEGEIAMLAEPAERNASAKRDIDQLYSDVFAGTTQGFPEEDAREREYEQAVQAHKDATAAVETERATVRALDQARGSAYLCHDLCGMARDASRWDMFGGGMMADMAERSHLEKADAASRQMIQHIDRAQHLNPAVKPLPVAKIASGHFLGDFLFDNIASDMAFHEKIKASQDEAKVALDAVRAEHDAATARKEEKKSIAKQCAQTLDQARKALYDARNDAFGKTVQNAALFD